MNTINLSSKITSYKIKNFKSLTKNGDLSEVAKKISKDISFKDLFIKQNEINKNSNTLSTTIEDIHRSINKLTNKLNANINPIALRSTKALKGMFTYSPLDIGSLTETGAVTMATATSMLLAMGFKQDEINRITFNNDGLTNTNRLYNYIKNTRPNLSDAYRERTKNERIGILGILNTYPNLDRFDVQYTTKYINEKNFDTLKKYIDINNEDDIAILSEVLAKCIYDENEMDALIKAINQLTDNGKHKLIPSDLYWFFFEDNQGSSIYDFNNVTPEMYNFRQKINTQVPKEFRLKLYELTQLSPDEDMTDEMLSSYIKIAKELDSLNIYNNIYISGDDDKISFKNKVNTLNKTFEIIKATNIKLNTDENGKRTISKFIPFIDNTNHKGTIDFLKNINEDTQSLAFSYPPEAENLSEDMAKIYNSTQELTPDKTTIIDFVFSTPELDLKIFNKYLKQLKGSQLLNNEKDTVNVLMVRNNDYEGAATLLKKIKSVYSKKSYEEFIQQPLINMIKNKDYNFRKANNNLNQMINEKLALPNINNLTDILAKDDINQYRILSQYGFYDKLFYSLVEITKNSLGNVPNYINNYINNHINDFITDFKKYTQNTESAKIIAKYNDQELMTIINAILENDQYLIMFDDGNKSIDTKYKFIANKIKELDPKILDFYINNKKLDMPTKIKISKEINKNNIDTVLNHIINSKEIPEEYLADAAKSINKDNKSVILHSVLHNSVLSSANKLGIMQALNKNNVDIAEEYIIHNTNIPPAYKSIILSEIEDHNKDFATKHIINNSKIPIELKRGFIKLITPLNKDIVEKHVINNPELSVIEKFAIVKSIKKYNKDFAADKIINNNDIPPNLKARFLNSISLSNKKFALNYILPNKILKSEDKIKLLESTNQFDISQKILTKVLSNPKYTKNSNIISNLGDIFSNIDKEYQFSIIETVLENPDINNDSNFMQQLFENIKNYKNKDHMHLHHTLINDAFKHKDQLKMGTEDLCDFDLYFLMSRPYTAIALDRIGLTNLEAAFPLMIDNFTQYCEDIAQMQLSKENEELLKKIINPNSSQDFKILQEEINNLKAKIQESLTPEEKAQIDFLQEKITHFPYKSLETKKIKKQIQKIYINSSKAETINNFMQVINNKTKKLKSLNKINHNISPQDVVKRTRVLAKISTTSNQNTTTNFIKLIADTTPNGNKAWNDAINKKIFENLGIAYDQKTSDKLHLEDCKYLSELFVSNEDFTNNMKELVEIIKNNPDKTIKETLDELPQNKETKRQFKELGIDFDKFVNVDPNSYTVADVTLKEDEIKQGTINNLNEDFNLASFYKIPQKQRNDILEALASIGVTLENKNKDVFIGDGFENGQRQELTLVKDNKPITFDMMKSIIKVIKTTMNNDDFWSTSHADPEINNAKDEIYEHMIKTRNNEINNAHNIKGEIKSQIRIQKADMYDIKKSIGLGNDGQCCTALGKNANEWTAPSYIKNKCIGAIELLDGDNYVGNTMFYIGYVDDKPALVLDNIELKTKYQFNNNIRDAFLDYAKKICTEIGQPELPIYAGPNRHKLNMDVYKKQLHNLEIVGNSGEDEMYIDYDAREHIIGNGEIAQIYMYKLR